MRRLVKRGMAPGTEQTSRQRELSQEAQDAQDAKRDMRRRVREFWSKQAHGYTPDDLKCVRAVNFGHCHLSDDDGIALASQLTAEMTQLRELHLYGNRLHDRAMEAIAQTLERGSAPLLTQLHMGHNAIGDVGMRALVAVIGEHGALARLEQLTLFQNRIGAEGISALVQCAVDGAQRASAARQAARRDPDLPQHVPPGPLSHLVLLGLSGNPMGDNGMSALADAVGETDEVLPNLVELHVKDTGATADGGLAALAGALMPTRGGLPQLRTLVVDEGALENPRLKEACSARTGQGGHDRSHNFKMVAHCGWA